MNFIQNLIVRKAEKIQKKETASKKPECPKFTSNEIDQMLKGHAKQLLGEIKPNMQPPRWEIGKTLWLNVYNTNSEFEQLYGWDGGYRGLLNLISNEQQNTIPTVVVTDVSINSMWFDELIQRFIDFRTNEEDALDYHRFKTRFIKYVNERGINNPEVKQNLGLYYDVKFKPTTFDFSPSWGLSEYSWIDPLDAKSLTVKEVWEKVITLNRELENKKAELNEIQAIIDLLEKQLER